MARTYFVTDGVIGVDVEKAYDDQSDFSIGRGHYQGTDGTRWELVSLNTAVVGGDVVTIDENQSAKPATTAAIKAGHGIGVVVTAGSAGKYIFATREGVVKARVGALTSADKKLFIGGTDGVLTSTATGGASIRGAVAVTAGGAATALRTIILQNPTHKLASA